jgi:hypothetical protein
MSKKTILVISGILILIIFCIIIKSKAEKCPKCGSSDVRVEVLVGYNVKRCQSCTYILNQK